MWELSFVDYFCLLQYTNSMSVNPAWRKSLLVLSHYLVLHMRWHPQSLQVPFSSFFFFFFFFFPTCHSKYAHPPYSPWLTWVRCSLSPLCRWWPSVPPLLFFPHPTRITHVCALLWQLTWGFLPTRIRVIPISKFTKLLSAFNHFLGVFSFLTSTPVIKAQKEHKS